MTMPGYGGPDRTDLDGREGVPTGVDPTLEPGNYGDSLFGVQLPQGTGSPGSAPGPGPTDPTVQEGQLDDGLSGLSRDQIDETGSPGSQGVGHPAGGQAVSFTDPGAFLSGRTGKETVQADITGPGDWTQAAQGLYSAGGTNLPGIQGNTGLADTGSGGGSVMRGGRAEG